MLGGADPDLDVKNASPPDVKYAWLKHCWASTDKQDRKASILKRMQGNLSPLCYLI